MKRPKFRVGDTVSYEFVLRHNRMAKVTSVRRIDWSDGSTTFKYRLDDGEERVGTGMYLTAHKRGDRKRRGGESK